MDWIKVKVKHAEYEFSGASDAVFRSWIMMMMFVAAVEHIPTKEQFEARLGKDNYNNLVEFFAKTGGSIDIVLEKVMEDVDSVKRKRQHDSEYMTQYRRKTLHKPLHNPRVSHDVKGKIRLDKIREDKRREETHTPPKAAVSTPQADFIANWGSLYEKATGLPYKHDKKDFILAAALIKKYSPAVVLDKARLLFGSCQGDGSLWFATGMGDFTVGKLSSKWNEIVPGKKKDKTQEIIEAGDRWEKKMKEAGL